jgi:hypothetical protein
MAYTSGTGTANFTDVMAALISFATSSCGFTLEGLFTRTENLSYNGTSTGTVYEVRCLSRGGVYWWFRYTNDNMFCLLSTGTGATWSTIANRAGNDSEVNLLTGSYPLYRFFEVDDSVHVALQRNNGGVISYNHFSFGKIQKVGSWTGGEYFANSYQEVSNSTHQNNESSTYHGRLFNNKDGAVTSGTGTQPTTRASYGVIRCTYNSKDYANIGRDYNSTETGMNETIVNDCFTRGRSDDINFSIHDDYAPSIWSSTALGTAPIISLWDSVTTNKYQELGYVTGLRFLNIESIDADDLVHTDWRAYPLSYKGSTGAPGLAASGNYGIAFQEVA